MPVDGPQFLEDSFLVVEVPPQYHQAHTLLQVSLTDGTAAGCYVGDHVLDAGISSQFDGNNIPAHLSAALVLFFEQAAAAFPSPDLEFSNDHK